MDSFGAKREVPLFGKWVGQPAYEPPTAMSVRQQTQRGQRPRSVTRGAACVTERPSPLQGQFQDQCERRFFAGRRAVDLRRSFSGWALGMWIGITFGNLLWLATSVLMCLWLLWFGLALACSEQARRYMQAGTQSL